MATDVLSGKTLKLRSNTKCNCWGSFCQAQRSMVMHTIFYWIVYLFISCQFYQLVSSSALCKDGNSYTTANPNLNLIYLYSVWVKAYIGSENVQFNPPNLNNDRVG